MHDKLNVLRMHTYGYIARNDCTYSYTTASRMRVYIYIYIICIHRWEKIRCIAVSDTRASGKSIPVQGVLVESRLVSELTLRRILLDRE